MEMRSDGVRDGFSCCYSRLGTADSDKAYDINKRCLAVCCGLELHMRIKKRNLPASAFFAVAAVVCTIYSMSADFGQPQISGDSRLQIIATTTMIYDLTSEIAGGSAVVTGLMGAGIDPHQYQASAGDVVKLQNADVVVYTGLHLEGRMGEVFKSLEKHGKTVVCIADSIEESKLICDDKGTYYDPHIWFDIALWKNAAHAVASALGIADESNSATYQTNLEAYLMRLEELEQYVLMRVDDLEASRRVLITAHDAFGYFGRAYGFEVLGLQGTNTSSEAGTRDVVELAQLIAERKINAVFLETSLPAKNIEALTTAVHSRGFEVTFGGILYSDSLGDFNSGHETYIAAFRSNIDTIVDALKEGAA